MFETPIEEARDAGTGCAGTGCAGYAAPAGSSRGEGYSDLPGDVWSELSRDLDEFAALSYKVIGYLEPSLPRGVDARGLVKGCWTKAYDTNEVYYRSDRRGSALRFSLDAPKQGSDQPIRVVISRATQGRGTKPWYVSFMDTRPAAASPVQAPAAPVPTAAAAASRASSVESAPSVPAAAAAPTPVLPAPAAAPAVPTFAASAGANAGPTDPLRLCSLMESLAATPGFADARMPQGVRAEFTSDVDTAVFMPHSKLSFLAPHLAENVDVRRFVADCWRAAFEADAVIYGRDGGGEFVQFPVDAVKPGGDEPIRLVLRRNCAPAARQGWFLSLVDTRSDFDLRRALHDFAWLGNEDVFFDRLAAMALPENWGFASAGSARSHGVLRSYIFATFHRLVEEDLDADEAARAAGLEPDPTAHKVRVDERLGFAAFNTGLVDPCYSSIYACFYPNPRAGEKVRQRWAFAGFATESTQTLGDRLVSCFEPLPQPASYFSSLEDMLYDTTRRLSIDYDHVIFERLDRFPVAFLEKSALALPAALPLVTSIKALPEGDPERKRLVGELKRMVLASNEAKRLMRDLFDIAVKVALKRVRWNYKSAVPCYFPRENSMSLLLPVGLADNAVADVALVVTLLDSGVYRGQTTITLPMAYLDSRLICRPDVDWLDVSVLSPDEDDEL